MESQPQNTEFRNNPEIFFSVFFLWSVIVAFPSYTHMLFECPRHVKGNIL